MSLLRAENFQVLAAERPQDALSLAEELERPLDLLISDVNLPGADGRHLAVEISLLHPQVKVIYMSGISRTQLDEMGVLGGGDFLEKPFELNDFVRRVRAALGR